MLAFIGWIIVGMVAGFLARALVPGRQAMGLLSTICLGLVGSLLGGWISSMLWPNPVDGFHAAGLLMSTLGAIVVLLVFIMFTRRRVERF